MSNQVLSQDEVDALLQGITGESRKPEQEEPVTGDKLGLRPREPGTHRAWAHAHDGDHQRTLRAQHPHWPDLVRKNPEIVATVAQLLALEPGDFFELDLKLVIQAKVSGVPRFDCHYGLSNGRYTLKVELLLMQASKGWLGEAQPI